MSRSRLVLLAKSSKAESRLSIRGFLLPFSLFLFLVAGWVPLLGCDTGFPGYFIRGRLGSSDDPLALGLLPEAAAAALPFLSFFKSTVMDCWLPLSEGGATFLRPQK